MNTKPRTAIHLCGGLVLAVVMTATTRGNGFDPSAQDQHLLELVNRMRLDPQAELPLLTNSSDPDVQSALAFFNVDLDLLAQQWSTLTPVPPLAWNESLSSAAMAHSQLMLDFDLQSHQLPGEADIGTRIMDAGYTNLSSAGESIFAFAEGAFHAHAAWAIDWGDTDTGIQDPPGHRENIMDPVFRELGVGVVAGTGMSTNNPHVGPLLFTKDFGDRFDFGNPFLLGVVFQDMDGDGFYSEGEGLGGVTVDVDGASDFQTATMTAGGYQVQIPSGMYNVTFSGGALTSDIVRMATIGTNNIKLDLLLDPPPPNIVCSLSPSSATNLIDTSHAVTVTVTSNGVAVSGVVVDFAVTAGPNVGVTNSDTTDGAGQGIFQYDSNGSTGTDTITATGMVGTVAFSCQAAKLWVPPPPVFSCSLDPQSATNFVGDVHAVVATVTSNGVPLDGIDVDFFVSAGPNVGESNADTTDGNGEAAFPYTGDGGGGTDTIMATGTVNGVAFSCSATKLWIVPLPDLQVAKNDSPDPVTAGNDLTYTVTVINNGTLAASGVVVTDALPASVSFVSAIASQGNCGPGVGTVVCNLGTLSIAQTATVTIVVTPTTEGTITNTASASSTETDLNTANNAASAITTVGAPLPDLTLAIENEDLACTNTAKGILCTSAGTLTLANNGFEYGSAALTIHGMAKVKPGKPTKWKVAALLDVITFNLGVNPTAFIQVYLSDDSTLGAGDTPLLSKPVNTEALAAAAESGKTVKLKIKLAKGTDLSGKHLIVVIDFDDQVDESNEDNNAVVIGPIP